MTANAIAKRLSSYDGTDNGAKELVDYISKVLGSAAVIGTEGLKMISLASIKTIKMLRI
jgi:hypothetical protein